jgi:phage terminase small subunit
VPGTEEGRRSPREHCPGITFGAPLMAPPKPPASLGKAGRTLWSALVGAFDFDAHERELVATACRQADVVADLEAIVKAEGHMVTSPNGVQKIHPAVVEARAGRQALARLLGALSLPDDPDDEPRLTEAQRRGRAAARARWNREKGTR